MNKCETCWNSRIILSENGFHYNCCLSEKKAINCLIHQKDYYLKKPDVKEDINANNYKT